MSFLLLSFVLAYLVGVLGIFPVLSDRRAGFLSRETTCCINGLFILIVFLSHLRQYIPSEAYGASDLLCLRVLEHLGQLMVATFLFFSGFGIMKSVEKNGCRQYALSMPTHRIAPFLADVWIALIPYLLIRFAQGNPPTLNTFLPALFGWQSIGNSNWYIFAILVMYLATYFALRLFNGKKPLVVVAVCLACSLYARLMISQDAGKWFYDTIFCYPAGMGWALLLGRWPRFGAEKNPSLILAIAISLMVFAFLYSMRSSRAMVFNLAAIAFSITIALASRVLPANGRAFVWLGEHLFYFYIYQRMPMAVFRPLSTQPLIYGLLCFITLAPMCIVMAHVHKRVKKWLFDPELGIDA